MWQSQFSWKWEGDFICTSTTNVILLITDTEKVQRECDFKSWEESKILSGPRQILLYLQPLSQKLSQNLKTPRVDPESGDEFYCF